ncbi:MAG: sigma-54 dependent transcriptional regulator [Pseudoflavonifractor sp.]|nr:sigma-54 dependent transcriptional regulator [Pseudoflavonifractor sp.]
MQDLSPEIQQAKARFGIIGNSPQLLAAVSRAIQVAPIDLSVLVTGESGTGKEFFPKIIHNFSTRKHAKYIAVNCGAIPEGTIDSELFGHEKGAFTGAVSSRKGYFEEADGGTIFLDEVAELPLTTQARLLRVLESGEFLKVGSSTVQRTDIRIVAATNVDMQKAVAEGRFREDLYYRLSTVLISIPPLRDRDTDIVLLARKFAADFAEKYRTPVITFDDSARRLLLSYRWPGNVRQLKNVVEQAALFDAGNEIDASTLQNYIPRNATVYTPAVTAEHTHTYAAERELLFNMIFRMQHEIDALRKQVEGAASTSRPRITECHPASEFDHTHSSYADMPRSLVKYTPPTPGITDALDITSDAVETQLSDHLSGKTLEETERETILQALDRNAGRRKATAKELNISERTLYRKIKEYGLE